MSRRSHSSASSLHCLPSLRGDVGRSRRDTGYDFAAPRASRTASCRTRTSSTTTGRCAFVAGLAALIGGSSIGAFVALGLGITVGIVAATYALARTQTGPVGSAIAATATAAIAFSPTNLSFVLPHTYSVTLAILLTLVFLLGLSAASNGRSGGAVIAGVAAGLIALTRPEFEAAVILGAALWLLARARGGMRIRRDLVALAFPRWPSRRSSTAPFSRPCRRTGSSSRTCIRGRRCGQAAAQSCARRPRSRPTVSLSSSGISCSTPSERRRSSLRRSAWRGSGLLWPSRSSPPAALVLLVAVINPEAVRSKLQWVFGGVPAAVGLAAIVLVFRHVVRRRPLDARDQTLLVMLVVLAVLAAKTYSGFFFLAERAQPAVYAAPSSSSRSRGFTSSSSAGHARCSPPARPGSPCSRSSASV
jgi:hypothetical protein